MGTAKIMFLWPTGPNDIIGDAIQFGEGGIDKPTHVAVVLDSSLLEATALGIRKTSFNRYSCRHREIWEISVIHPEFIDLAVQILLGRKYSYLSCLSGLFRDKFGIKLPLVNCCQDDCSETATIFLACLGRNLFNNDDPSGITPKDLYEEIQRRGGRLVEKWPLPN